MVDQIDRVVTTEPVSGTRENLNDAIEKEVSRLEGEGFGRPVADIGVVSELLDGIRNVHWMNQIIDRNEVTQYGVDTSILKGLSTNEITAARDWLVGDNKAHHYYEDAIVSGVDPELIDIDEAIDRILAARVLDEAGNDISPGKAAVAIISANISERKQERIEKEGVLTEAQGIDPEILGMMPRGIDPEMAAKFQVDLEIKPSVLKELTTQEAHDAHRWLSMDTWEKREAFQEGLKAAAKIPFSAFMHSEAGERHPVETHRQEKLLAAVKLPDLAPEEVNARALETTRVHSAREKAENLAVAVYGQASGISKMIREIEASGNPAALASEKASALRADPQSIGELPGRPGGWLRGPDQERKAALVEVSELARSVEKFGLALNYERDQVVKAHLSEQQKVAVEIPAPSNALSAVLAFPTEQRLNALQNAPEVARELQKIVQASEVRLSQQERREIAAGQTTILSERHDLSVARANRITHVVQQSTQLNDEYQKQVRQQSLARNVGTALAR